MNGLTDAFFEQFSEDMTFSLELEFNPFIQGGELWEKICRVSTHYSKEKKRELILDNIVEALDLPEGWVIQAPHGEENYVYFEIKTRSKGRDYHLNTREHWKKLLADLDRVQDLMPKGFYSAHLHIGQNSLVDLVGSKIDRAKLAMLVKFYEKFWVVLSGHTEPILCNKPYSVKYSVGLAYSGVRPLFFERDSRRGSGTIHEHGLFVNSSTSYSTVEFKSITSLLRRSPQNHLNIENLQKDLWWAFALFKRVASSKPFYLANAGIPVPAMNNPSKVQVRGFLKEIYGDDPVGEKIAVERLELLKSIPSVTHAVSKSVIELELASTFYGLGLGVVYELHEESEGLECSIEERIMKSHYLLERLREDMKNARALHNVSEIFRWRLIDSFLTN